MKIIEVDKKFASDKEYFLFEEGSELKHELINENLHEMSGSSKKIMLGMWQQKCNSLG